MNILPRETGVPQFRCLPLIGRKDEFRYVQMLNGCWQPINHGDVTQAVGDTYRKMSEGQCESSTDDLPTSAAYQSKSSAGSLNQTGLSTFAKTTNMASASALLTSSSVTSGK